MRIPPSHLLGLGLAAFPVMVIEQNIVATAAGDLAEVLDSLDSD